MVKPKREPAWLRLSFPQRFSLAFLGQKLHTSRNPSASGGGCRFIPTALYRQVRVQGDHPPGGAWGETPALSCCLIDTLNKVAGKRLDEEKYEILLDGLLP